MVRKRTRRVKFVGKHRGVHVRLEMFPVVPVTAIQTEAALQIRNACFAHPLESA